MSQQQSETLSSCLDDAIFTKLSCDMNAAQHTEVQKASGLVMLACLKEGCFLRHLALLVWLRKHECVEHIILSGLAVSDQRCTSDVCMWLTR